MKNKLQNFVCAVADLIVVMQRVVRVVTRPPARAVRNQRAIRHLRGSVVWEDDLQESRLGRTPNTNRP